MSAPPSPPTIVHIGAFDLASYGDQIYPLVAATELRRRLGAVDVLPFGPVGSIDEVGGASCWALGPWSAERAAELAQRATIVLCGGGEIIQGDGDVYTSFYGIDSRDSAALSIDRWFIETLGPSEADCPVVWHAPGVPGDLQPDEAERVRTAASGRALVAVRDELSRKRLENAGVEGTIEVVPDSAFLLPRVLPADQLEGWRDRLRRSDHYPTGGRVLVVQGNGTMTGLIPELALALRTLPPDVRLVTVAVSPCHDDGGFAEELVAHVGGRTWSVPPDASLEAVAAAIAGADCFLGVSLHGAITALAYGRQFVTFDPFGQSKLSGFAAMVDAPNARTADPAEAVQLAGACLANGAGAARSMTSIDARIDEYFDRVADLVRSRSDQPANTPFTWSDTPLPLHLALRWPPRAVSPAASSAVPGVRRPDVAPTLDDMRWSVRRAILAGQEQRTDLANDHKELMRLRRENQDLRGAVAHLEAVQQHTDDEVRTLRAELEASEVTREQLARSLDAARRSRIFRLTRRPAALRDEADDPARTPV